MFVTVLARTQNGSVYCVNIYLVSVIVFWNVMPFNLVDCYRIVFGVLSGYKTVDHEWY